MLSGLLAQSVAISRSQRFDLDPEAGIAQASSSQSQPLRVAEPASDPSRPHPLLETMTEEAPRSQAGSDVVPEAKGGCEDGVRGGELAGLQADADMPGSPTARCDMWAVAEIVAGTDSAALLGALSLAPAEPSLSMLSPLQTSSPPFPTTQPTPVAFSYSWLSRTKSAGLEERRPANE